VFVSQKTNDRKSMSSLWDSANELSRHHEGATSFEPGKGTGGGETNEGRDASRRTVLVIEDDVPTRLLMVHGQSAREGERGRG